MNLNHELKEVRVAVGKCSHAVEAMRDIVNLMELMIRRIEKLEHRLHGSGGLSI